MAFWWCCIGLTTVVLLPSGVAMLRGWTPSRARGRWSPERVRVQGVSVLVWYLGSLVPPVLRLSGLPRETADDVLSAACPSLFFLALGFQGGAALCDWFERRGVRQPAATQVKIGPRDASDF